MKESNKKGKRPNNNVVVVVEEDETTVPTEPSPKRVKRSSADDDENNQQQQQQQEQDYSNTNPLTAKASTPPRDDYLMPMIGSSQGETTTRDLVAVPPELFRISQKMMMTMTTIHQEETATATTESEKSSLVPNEEAPAAKPTTIRRVHFSSPTCTIPIIQETAQQHAQTTMTTSTTEISTAIWKLLLLVFCGCCCCAMVVSFEWSPQRHPAADHHLIPPSHSSSSSSNNAPNRANMTLRDFLLDPAGIHLALAPSFFGYYGYFGALAAWDDALSNATFKVLEQETIHSVAGASAGAMAAILLAAGIPPRDAAAFCATITLSEFNDFPGFLTVFQGHKFEQLMQTFLQSHYYTHNNNNNGRFLLQETAIPVAVSGFDLQTMQGTLLSRGSMARAARASACFPFLFQPVGWVDGTDNYLLVDGGIMDASGLEGLAAFDTASPRRIVNIVVGEFLWQAPPGPSQMPDGVHASEVLSISIQKLPHCGPWAMANGPLAVEGARRAMEAAMDLPLYLGNEKGHYELHIDASSFVPSS